MKRIKNFISYFLVVCFVVSCGVVSSVEASAKSSVKLSLYSGSSNMKIGRYSKFVIKGLKKKQINKIKWSTSNSKIKIVGSKTKKSNKSGKCYCKIKAVKSGTAYLYAKYKGKKYKKKITVKKATTKSVSPYSKLVSYMKSNGSTNSDGNLVISSVENSNSTTYTASIIYNTSTGEFEFDLLESSTSSKSNLSLTGVYASSHNNIKINYNYTSGSTYLKSKYTGRLSDISHYNSLTWTSDTNLLFYSASSSLFENTDLDLSYYKWKSLISNADVSMTDLGFDS